MLTHDKGVCYLLPPNWRNWDRPTVTCISTISSPDYRVAGAQRQEEDYMAFQYTLSGCGCFFDGRREHRLPPGRGFLIPITDPGYVYFYPRDAAEPWRVLCFCATGDSLLKRVRELNRLLGYLFDLPLNDELILRLSRNCQPDFPSVSIPVPEANLLLTAFFNRLIVSREAKGNSAGQLAQKAHALMLENLHRPFNLEQIARTLFISREHLSRSFRHHYGQPPCAYFSTLRNERAKFLLSHTRQTVKEIAGQLGFNSPTVFINSFRKYCGVTPAQYRTGSEIHHKS